MGGAAKHIGSVSEFKNLLSTNQYVVVDFYADWCPPCKAIAPKYEELAAQYSVPNFLAFAKVNCDNVQALAAEHGINAMPSFIFFKNGNRVKVNGSLKIEGADYFKLKEASAKMGKLAGEKAAAAEELK